MTKEQEEKYLKSPIRCPYCGSEAITGSYVEIEFGAAWQDVTCEDCDKEWRDLYSLTGVEVDDE